MSQSLFVSTKMSDYSYSRGGLHKLVCVCVCLSVSVCVENDNGAESGEGFLEIMSVGKLC